MTKKKSTRSRTRKSSSKKKSGANRPISIVVIIGFAVLAGLYFFAGMDPLGLFTGDETTSTRPAPPSLVGSGGDWWQVYFTNPEAVNDPENLTGSIPEKLIEYIDNAQDSIYIAAFEFNLTPVAEALITAHKRGVDVKWITDDEHGLDADFEEGHGQFEMLEDAGIEVMDDGRAALMHNKFWIFDGQTVWTGSTNITQNGNFRNNNNVIIIENSDVAAIYQREFDEMWNGEFGPTSTSTVSRQSTTIDGTPVQIMFAAEDEVISYLAPLVDSAQESVRFMAFSFTHDDLGQAMLRRARAGVDVAGIFETRASETEYSELAALYCDDVPVRQDGNPGTFHHKVIVVDGKTVVTGSLNFSENADDSNDENVVIINNSDIAAEYLKEFDRRWAEATEPDPADLVSCP